MPAGYGGFSRKWEKIPAEFHDGALWVPVNEWRPIKPYVAGTATATQNPLLEAQYADNGAGLGKKWTDHTNNPCYYMKDPWGFVHFKGIVRTTDVNNGASPDVIFTLPHGYRPINNIDGVSANQPDRFVVLEDTAGLTTRMVVIEGKTGAVRLGAGGGGANGLYMSQISFRADSLYWTDGPSTVGNM